MMISTIRVGEGQSAHIRADAGYVTLVTTDHGNRVSIALNAHTAAHFGAELERAALHLDRTERLAAGAAQ